MSDTTTKVQNPHRISAAKALRDAGYDTVDDFLLSSEAHDSIVPACCDNGCEIEPDGHCEHGCPSVLLALHVI